MISPALRTALDGLLIRSIQLFRAQIGLCQLVLFDPLCEVLAVHGDDTHPAPEIVAGQLDADLAGRGGSGVDPAPPLLSKGRWNT